jgi:23S rRNA pseudouridine1911/1915/1917 synthase
MSSQEPIGGPIELTIGSADVGKRLDAYLAERFPDYSRVHLRRVIGDQRATVDGRAAKGAHRLRVGETVQITLPELPRSGPIPEDIPLDVLYEDEHLVAINKPANMVVHPAKGHWSGTLTSALAFRFEQLSTLGGATRPGIVHRLDRETSGVIVVAKTDRAHFALGKQFEARSTRKEYVAIVVGVPDRDRDVIAEPIGIHPYQREKMAIRANHLSSREAETFYEVVERFRHHALVRVEPKTGRTHQIRVHLSHVGFPVLCDRLYGGRSSITRGELLGTNDESVVLSRHALHARRLSLNHPITREPLEFIAPLSADLDCLLQVLRETRPRA